MATIELLLKGRDQSVVVTGVDAMTTDITKLQLVFSMYPKLLYIPLGNVELMVVSND